MIDETKLANAIKKIRPMLPKVRTPERRASDKRLFKRFQKVFAWQNIDELTEQNFRDFTSYKQNEHWSGIHRQNGKVLRDFNRVKQALKILLNEGLSINERFDQVVDGDLKVKGLAETVLSAILLTVYPNTYCVLNGKVEKAFDILGLTKSFDSSGAWYEYVLEVCAKMKEELRCSYLDLDLCWHYIGASEGSDKEQDKGEKMIPGRFQGFDERAFDILEEFKGNPVKATYEKHKNDFYTYLNDPMKALFSDIAEPVKEAVGDAIETRVRLLSAICKNDFGRGGIYHHFWGAFFEPEMGRKKSTQLYVIIKNGVLRFGFGFGFDASAFAERLRRNIRKHSLLDDDYFEALSQLGVMTRLFETDDISEVKNATDAKNYVDVLLKNDEPALEVTLTKDEVVELVQLGVNKPIPSMYKY